MRVACLLVPNLALVAQLRAEPELAGKPLVIAAGPDPRAEIVAVSPQALREGVQTQNSVAHGRAACSTLCVRVASPALDRAARDTLLDVAFSGSPRAAEASRGADAYAAEAAVFLDASGVTALFHSEAGFATALSERAQRLGLPTVVTIASSRAVAQIAARSLDGIGVRVLPPGAEAAFLAPLSVDLLDAPDRLAEALTRFGIRRIGELARLPRRGLARRLGPEALRLAELAQGRDEYFSFSAVESRHFEEAVDLEFAIDRLEPLTFVLRGMLSRLTARLAIRGLACGPLELRLALGDDSHDARRIGVSAPTLDVRILVRLVGLALETRPPSAPIEGVLLATEGHTSDTDQLDLFRPAGPAPAVLGRTLAELEALCGPNRVGSPSIANSNHPDALALRPFELAQSSSVGEAGPQHALVLRALRPPVRAVVRWVGGRPRWVQSAVANGQVLAVAGPWRTTGGWWSPEGYFAVDHFDLQTNDGTLARFRFDLLRRTWHVDGVYD